MPRSNKVTNTHAINMLVAWASEANDILRITAEWGAAPPEILARIEQWKPIFPGLLQLTNEKYTKEEIEDATSLVAGAVNQSGEAEAKQAG